MLRVILIALVVLVALRWLARLTAPRAAAPPDAQPPRERDVAGRQPKETRPELSATQRAELEAERERALREGRQIDATRLHRKLTDGR
jgi:hypothetical protein